MWLEETDLSRQTWCTPRVPGRSELGSPAVRDDDMRVWDAVMTVSILDVEPFTRRLVLPLSTTTTA